jgi:hypothetical protein
MRGVSEHPTGFETPFCFEVMASVLAQKQKARRLACRLGTVFAKPGTPQKRRPAYIRALLSGGLTLVNSVMLRSLLRLPAVASSLLLLALLPQTARAQTAPPLPTFFTTYAYTAYTVYDTTNPDEPTQVSGVGGTLMLRPDGTYEKHLSIVAPSGPYYFNQKGSFVLSGDSIRFSFTDLKGADTQRGTFVFDPTTQHLTLTVLGYPVGNKGVYELVAAPQAAPAPPATTPRKKRRR